MIKNIGLVASILLGAVILVIFGSGLLHFLDREKVLAGIGNPPYGSAHAPEVFKDTTGIPALMDSMATDTAVHPGVVGKPGERAVFQRNYVYKPAPGRSWETALKSAGSSAFALSSRENFIAAVGRGLPGTDAPGASQFTAAEWDSLYAAAKAAAR